MQRHLKQVNFTTGTQEYGWIVYITIKVQTRLHRSHNKNILAKFKFLYRIKSTADLVWRLQKLHSIGLQYTILIICNHVIISTIIIYHSVSCVTGTSCVTSMPQWLFIRCYFMGAVFLEKQLKWESKPSQYLKNIGNEQSILLQHRLNCMADFIL